MRGDDEHQPQLFSYRSLEDRVRPDHPLRRLRPLADAALARLSARFDDIYGDAGRPSIASEKLLRALLLQVLYSVRSERALMDQIDLHLGFRWFVGLSADEPVWEASTFSKNRERLLGGDIALEFLHAVLAEGAATANTAGPTEKSGKKRFCAVRRYFAALTQAAMVFQSGSSFDWNWRPPL